MFGDLLAEKTDVQRTVIHRDGIGIVRIIRLPAKLEFQSGNQTRHHILTAFKRDAHNLGWKRLALTNSREIVALEK